MESQYAKVKLKGRCGLATANTRTQDTHLELDDHMPLTVAHEVSDDVEAAIMAAIPQADVMIHLDPVSLAEEQLDDRIEAVEQSDGS